MYVHQSGVCHNDMDYAERNIVITPDGDIRIIDFEDSTLHECKCSFEVYIDAFPPRKVAFGCHELWEVCNNLLWTPGESLRIHFCCPSRSSLH